jgi:hypothetical protein
VTLAWCLASLEQLLALAFASLFQAGSSLMDTKTWLLRNTNKQTSCHITLLFVTSFLGSLYLEYSCTTISLLSRVLDEKHAYLINQMNQSI